MTRPPSRGKTLEQAITDALVQGDEAGAAALLRRAFGRRPDAGADDLPELLEELAEYFVAQDRPEDAIGAAGRAVMLTKAPGRNTDAVRRRCRIAEILLKAGLPDEACAVYASVAEDAPHETCVHEAAGNDYLDVGDPELAFAWTTAGIELAVSESNVSDCLGRLIALRRATMAELGWDPDELDQRASELLVQVRRGRRVDDLYVETDVDLEVASDRAAELLEQLRLGRQG